MSAYWHPVPIHAAVCPAGLHFRALLGQKLAHAYLVNLWGWCHQYRPKRTFTGDLRAVTVADAAGWTRSPAKFTDALVAAGWADDDGATLTLREPCDVAEGKYAERAQGAAVDTSRQSKRQRDAKYKAKVKAAKKATVTATPGDASPATPSDAPATPPATTPATTPESVEGPRAYFAGAYTHETDTDTHIEVQKPSSSKLDAPAHQEPSSPESRGTSQVAGGGAGLFGDVPDPKAVIEERITAVLVDWRTRVSGTPKAAIEGKAADARRKRIRARLSEGWTVERLADVVSGALKDDWLMGRDPNVRPEGYRDVESVFRDNSQCERLEAKGRAALIRVLPSGPPVKTFEFVPPPELTPEEQALAAKARDSAPNFRSLS